MRRWFNFDSMLLVACISVLLILLVIKVQPVYEEIRTKYLEEGVILSGTVIIESLNGEVNDSTPVYHYEVTGTIELVIISKENVFEYITPKTNYLVKLNKGNEDDAKSFTIKPHKE